MGKKVNPKIMRLGITKSWDSVWFESGQNYIKNVAQDIQVRRYIIKNFREAGIEKVQITRNLSNIRVDVWTGKPGLIIGRGGNGVEELKKTIHRRFLKNFRPNDIILNIFLTHSISFLHYSNRESLLHFPLLYLFYNIFHLKKSLYTIDKSTSLFLDENSTLLQNHQM